MAKYLKTGLKLIVLNVIVVIITLVFNLMLYGIAFLVGSNIIKGDYLSWIDAMTNPLFIIVFIFLLIIYLISIIFINGYLSQKLWKWR